MNNAVMRPAVNELGIVVQRKVSSGNHNEEWVDISQLLRQSLQKNACGSKEQLILRIDPLPLVYCNRNEYEQLIEALVQMIVQYPPANSKLFLYIKCEKDESVPVDKITKAAFYKISFYTNIITDHNWMKLYQEKIATSIHAFSEKGNRLSFQEITNTGCLFSITLPGKIS